MSLQNASQDAFGLELNPNYQRLISSILAEPEPSKRELYVLRDSEGIYAENVVGSLDPVSRYALAAYMFLLNTDDLRNRRITFIQFAQVIRSYYDINPRREAVCLAFIQLHYHHQPKTEGVIE